MSELVTWFCAMPLSRSDDGQIIEDEAEAIQCESPRQAVAIARLMADEPHHCAAIAFSRSGDLATGWYSDAEVLARFGKFWPGAPY